MAMELLPLSNFKLQLLSLISESHDLRERERSAREQLDRCNQNLKQIKEDYSKKLQELHADLASRDDMNKKLESRIKYLENENELLEKKEKDLKDSINGLLQSRESFIHHYEESTCNLQRTIQMKDRELALVSEKLNANIVLFNSVEREVSSVERAFLSVKQVLNEKEQVVARLNDKIRRVCTLEKDFIEKINLMESKLNDCKIELRNKDTKILELQEQLESEKIGANYQFQIEQLQKALTVKDETVQRLTSEKQSMRLELHNMETVVRKFQDIVSNLKLEISQDKEESSPELENQTVSEMAKINHIERFQTLEDNNRAIQSDSGNDPTNIESAQPESD